MPPNKETQAGGTTVHHVGSRSMYIGLRGHGHQECHLIDPLGLMREDLTDPASRLTMLLELERAFHEPPRAQR